VKHAGKKREELRGLGCAKVRKKFPRTPQATQNALKTGPADEWTLTQEGGSGLEGRGIKRQNRKDSTGESNRGPGKKAWTVHRMRNNNQKGMANEPLRERVLPLGEAETSTMNYRHGALERLRKTSDKTGKDVEKNKGERVPR